MMGGLVQRGGLKDDTLKHLLTYQCRGEGAALGMALRQDVARCVKVVGILAVDGWRDMT